MVDLIEESGSGRVEKIFSTYGFIMDERGQRHFFHFGKCVTKPEMLQAGDYVTFVLGQDLKSGRVHAQKVCLSKGHNSMTPMSHSTPLSTLNPAFYNQFFPPLTTNSGSNPQLTNDQRLSDPVSAQGVVVVAPNDYGESARGTVAFTLANETFIAEFAWSALKFPQERSLVKFATPVDMTVSYQPITNSWVSRHLLPKVPEVQGIVSSVTNQSACIELSHIRRRVIYPLRFYTGKDLTFIQPGTCVQFILVSSPKGEIASRLRILEPGAVTIERVSPKSYYGQVLALPDDENDYGYVEMTNDRGIKEPVQFVKSDMANNIDLLCGDFVDFHIKLDTRDNSKYAVSMHPMSLSPCPSEVLSERSSSGVSSVEPVIPKQGQMRGFVAANTINGGALIETHDHLQLLAAKYDGVLYRFQEVSFDIICDGDMLKASNITVLQTGTISSNFVLSSEVFSGVVVKEPDMDDVIYEGLIDPDITNINHTAILDKDRRYPFTLLSLCSPIEYPKMVVGARVLFQIQAEPCDERRAVLVRCDNQGLDTK